MNETLASTETTIKTYTGLIFNVFEPDPEKIRIEDIAHALSNLCRFGGHVKHFSSVAEHSLLVAQDLPQHLKLWGLLHDASEAYLVDLPTPIKNAQGMDVYRSCEVMLMQIIAEKFGLSWPMPEEVRFADRAMLKREMDALIFSAHVKVPRHPYVVKGPRASEFDGTHPEIMERIFLARFIDYAGFDLVEKVAPHLLWEMRFTLAASPGGNDA